MTTPIQGDRRVAVLQQALGGLAQRQQAIAGNIANVDTPGYQRRDVSFESALRSGMGSGTRMMQTDGRHIGLAPAGASLFGEAAADAGQTRTPRSDGNDVDIDYEMTQLAETGLRYQLLTQATSARFTTLRDLVSRIA